MCIVGWDIEGEGINAVQGILSVAPAAAVVVLSENSDVDDLLAAVRAGAVGYLPGASMRSSCGGSCAAWPRRRRRSRARWSAS